MNEDTLLVVGGLGLAGFALYKALSDSGVTQTTGAVGTIADTTAGAYKDVVSTGTDIFKAGTSAVQSVLSGSRARTSSPLYYLTLPGQITGASQLLNAGIEGLKTNSAKLFSGSSGPSYASQQLVSSAITAAAIKSESSLNPNLGISSSFLKTLNVVPSGQSSLLSAGTTTTKYVTVPSSIIGAKSGTIFSSGASVKSTGASGKYKTTL